MKSYISKSTPIKTLILAGLLLVNFLAKTGLILPTFATKTPPSPPLSTISDAPTLIISALNPGYTVDGVRDAGEFIELRRADATQNSDHPADITQNSDRAESLAPLPLDGYALRYTTLAPKLLPSTPFPPAVDSSVRILSFASPAPPLRELTT